MVFWNIWTLVSGLVGMSEITCGKEYDVGHDFFTVVGLNFYTVFCFNKLYHQSNVSKSDKRFRRIIYH